MRFYVGQYADNRKLTHETNFSKLERLLAIIRYLHEKPRTVKRLMGIMAMSERQVYRYLSTINQSGIYLEKNFNNEYFITEDNCPICKQPKDQHQNASAAA